MRTFQLLLVVTLIMSSMTLTASPDPVTKSPDPKDVFLAKEVKSVSKQIRTILQESEMVKPTTKNGYITIYFRITDDNTISVINAVAYDYNFINETRKILDGKMVNTESYLKNRDLSIKISYEPNK